MSETPERPAAHYGVPVDHYRVERTADEGLILSAMAHPRIYRHVSDDLSPARGEFKPTIHPQILYLAVFKNDVFHGVFCLHPVNGVTLEVHTCLLPIAWGEAREFASIMLGWVWEFTGTERIITQVPAYNSLALSLAVDSGMTEFGLNPKCFLKNGELHDIHLLGISRGGACQQ